MKSKKIVAGLFCGFVSVLLTLATAYEWYYLGYNDGYLSRDGHGEDRIAKWCKAGKNLIKRMGKTAEQEEV